MSTVATDRTAARIAVSELRTILLTDPDAFDYECRKIIRTTDDEVTKQFWEDVRQFALSERDAAGR